MDNRILYLINHPFEVQLSDVALLQDEIEKYPYFSTLRSLLLFGLKEFKHESYNAELKKTSIYSPSRVALYHYLQKERQTPVVQEVKESVIAEPQTSNLTEVEAVQEEKTIQELIPDTQITTQDQVETKENAPIEVPEIGPFNKDQQLTFSQWLYFSKQKNTKEQEKPSEKDIKFQLIDEFIEKSPKIPRVKKTSDNDNSGVSVLKSINSNEYSDLMTETLAQIYTEQHKYDKAIRAYKILMLKYPEKEDFFSNKITEIKQLKEQK